MFLPHQSNGILHVAMFGPDLRQATIGFWGRWSMSQVILERGGDSPLTLIGMNWTTMPPTTPGWHWFRTVNGNQTPTLLWVCEFAGNLNALWPDGRYEPVMTMAGEWHGPVERPEQEAQP